MTMAVMLMSSLLDSVSPFRPHDEQQYSIYIKELRGLMNEFKLCLPLASLFNQQNTVSISGIDLKRNNIMMINSPTSKSFTMKQDG